MPVSNSVLIPPPQGQSLHPRSRANSLRARQHPRSRSNSTTTPGQSSSDTQSPSRRGSPTSSHAVLVEPIAPTPVLSVVDTQTAQMRHLVASASAEKEHLSAQIKEARRASQRAEAALRQEIDAVKKSTEKAGSLDLRAKQKALALQEQVKQGWAGAEIADQQTVQVESGMGDLETLLNAAVSEVDELKSGMADARDKEEDARERDKRMRAEEEKKLGEVVAKVEKLRLKKERKEAEKLDLERRIEDLERQRVDVERQAEEDSKRIASGGHWPGHGGWDGHHESGHNRLTTHPSLSNIGAQGGYGAGPAYRPRGAQGYQPRFPSAGAARPGAATSTTQITPSPFYTSASNSAAFRPPPPTPPPTKGVTIASPAIGSRTISSTSSGVNAAATPFVPSFHPAGTQESSNHTTLMPPGMQHRIYLPSQSNSGNFQNVRPRPTPTFHPPPSVLAEQAAQAQAQARNSPTTTSSPAFPPLPGVSSVSGPGSKSPASSNGPSLASIITRAVLSPTSSLSVTSSIPQVAGIAPGIRRTSPPETSVAGVSGGSSGAASRSNSLKSPKFAQPQSPISSPGPSTVHRSASPTPIPTPASSHSSIGNPQPYIPNTQGPGGRVTFAQQMPSSQDHDFPPLSPSGPWSSLNPSIGSRVRGESAEGMGQQGLGAGINRTQTPPAVWGSGGERVGSPLGIVGGPGQGQSRRNNEN